MPEIKIKYNYVEKGINILNFIAENNILSSKSEARRAITNNGIKINDVLVIDDKKIIQINDFKKNILKFSYGKKKHYLIKII